MTYPFLSAALAALALASPAVAETVPFNLTYHVERFDSAKLGADDCAAAVTATARDAGYGADSTVFPGQLVTVSGGPKAGGAFVAQCIVVDDKTVSVVQGIDYQPAKGPLGAFADAAHQAVLSAAR